MHPMDGCSCRCRCDACRVELLPEWQGWSGASEDGACEGGSPEDSTSEAGAYITYMVVVKYRPTWGTLKRAKWTRKKERHMESK